MRDLVAEVRAMRKKTKASCHHHWQETKGRHDRCSLCKEWFPCRKECGHLDCNEARIERGLDFDYSDECYEVPVVYTDVATGEVLLDGLEG